MGRRLSYADALKILGDGNSPALAAINDALGGLILGATAATGSIGLLSLLDGRSELLKQIDKLISRIGQRIRGATGRDRTDLLMAAQVTIAVTAFFEVLPDSLSGNVTLTDQLRLAGSKDSATPKSLVSRLLDIDVPITRPELAYEDLIELLRSFYNQLSEDLIRFLSGLALWDQLSDTDRSRLIRKFNDVPERAVRGYEESFRRLCVDCPDLLIWTLLRENAATRQTIRKTLREHAGTSSDVALAGFSELLGNLYGKRASAEWPERIANAYYPQLERPIAETVVAGLHIPTLGDAYVNPRCRIAAVTTDSRPAEDLWWEGQSEYEDVQWLLAGLFTSPGASDAPIVVLGQPGSGKSVLTKVLAATLPTSQFLPVRVELRQSQADASLQDQIEQAIFDATGIRMSWRNLVDQVNGVRPVILLDGFDELLQSTQVSQSDYLQKIQQFQRREADYGRPVIVVVTSRTVVADRMRYPEGTVALRLDPFSPDQVCAWLDIWNKANALYFTTHGLQPLLAGEVLLHSDLATQPLLLLMLALYDADGNRLPRHNELIDQADLYERLLSRFAEREVAKLHPNLDEAQADAEVARELNRLSIIAFAMFNRGQQVAFEGEIDKDLFGLLGEGNPSAVTEQFQSHLTAAQLAVGRFFFIHESQATLDSGRLHSYEFLHATFGEYLVARMIRSLLSDLSTATKASASAVFSPSRPDDSLLHALLSWAPLTDRRQICTFLVSLLRSADAYLCNTLIKLFSTVNETRLPNNYDRYAPVHHNTFTRNAMYAVNLLILILAAKGQVHGSELFSSGDATEWRKQAFLWRSALNPESFGGLVDALHVDRQNSQRDIQVSLASAGETWQPIVLDLSWSLTSDTSPGRDLTATEWTSWAGDDIYRICTFMADQDLDVLLHGVEPMLLAFPMMVSTAHAIPSGLRSPLHTLAQLELEGKDNAARAAQYHEALAVVSLISSERPREEFLYSTLKHLRSDAAFVGPQVVFESLRSALDASRRFPKVRTLIACICVEQLLRSPEPNEAWKLYSDFHGELTTAATLEQVAKLEPFLALEVIRFSPGMDPALATQILKELPESILARIEPANLKSLLTRLSRNDSIRLRNRWERGRLNRHWRADV